MPPQLIPVALTEPVAPATNVLATVSCSCASAKVATTLWSPSIVTVHGVAVHAPLHATVEPVDGAPSIVTVGALPVRAYEPVQVVPAHASPGADTVPAPLPPTETVSWYVVRPVPESIEDAALPVAGVAVSISCAAPYVVGANATVNSAVAKVKGETCDSRT